MSNIIVSTSDVPDQITVATLKDIFVKDLLKQRIPIIMKLIPTRFTGQSQRPFERFKQIFHTASVQQEIRRKGIPGFMYQYSF